MARACARLEADPEAGRHPRRLAAEVGLGFHAFRSRFAATTGMSVTAYRLQVRMRLASQLLIDLPVGAVADRLGYCNPFAFSQQFRRAMGMPPSRWRESHLG